VIELDFDAENLQLRLVGLSDALRDLNPVWGDLHQIFMDFMKRVFDAQGAYGGKQWAPLSPGYAAWKARHYPGKPILQLRGRLYPSFTKAEDPDHVYRTGPTFMETGSKVRYARAHHWGYLPNKLPARTIIRGFTRAEGERAADAVLAYLLKSMQRGR